MGRDVNRARTGGDDVNVNLCSFAMSVRRSYDEVICMLWTAQHKHASMPPLTCTGNLDNDTVSCVLQRLVNLKEAQGAG